MAENAMGEGAPAPALLRSRARDVAFVLLGVLGLVMKRRLDPLGGPLVHDDGGNVAASFAAYVLLANAIGIGRALGGDGVASTIARRA